MKKSAKKINSMMFDMASGATLLPLIGIPLVIVAITVILMIVAVKLIKKARKKNIKPENKDDSEKGE